MKNEKSALIVHELEVNIEKNRYFSAIETENKPAIRLELHDRIPIKTADNQLTEGEIITIGQIGKYDHKKNKNLFFVVKLPETFKPNIVARNMMSYLQYCIKHDIKIK